MRASLDDLAAFACVARHRSFRRAAAALGTSTSNLSHTIKRLEGRVGARLLQRNSRSVSASEAGEALLATLDPALRGIEGALDALDRGRGSVAGTLRITATRQAYDMVIRPALPGFTDTNPDATVEVLVEYGFRDIIADRFDAGIRLGEKIEQDMVAVKVGPDLRMAVVASPAYLARRGTPQHPRDLIEHRCINYRLVAAATIYAWEFRRHDSSIEVRVPGPLTFNDPGLMLDCALDGLGIAYLLEHEVAPHVRRGALVEVLTEWSTPFLGFFLYHPTRRHPRPVFAAFLAHLRRSAAAKAHE